MRKMLFWGEIYPNTINGIAIANNTNLQILGRKFEIEVLTEDHDFKNHNKFSWVKLFSTLKVIQAVILKCTKTRYEYFYLVFSLSTFGALKTLMVITFYKLFNRGKVIIHIHRGDFFTRFYQGFVNKTLSRLIFKLIYKVIVLSEEPQKEIEKISNKPCDVLHNTIDIEYKRSDKKKQNKKFIYISNYLIDKGIIDLLTVFKSLIDLYPELILETYGAFSNQKLKKIILNYNSHNIHINNTITDTDKYKKIDEADCLILPSWNEGQPIVLLESMSVGTPVIASRVGLIPDLLGKAYPYLSIPGDQVSLKEVILKFIESDENDSISKNLLTKYQQLYSKEIHEKELLKIFK